MCKKTSNLNGDIDPIIVTNKITSTVVVAAPIANSTTKTTAKTSDNKNLHLFSLILDRLCTHDFVHIFLEPVPVDEIPGYSKVVRHPMDIGSVKKSE